MGDRIAVMNDGVLEQVGTPEELYERPANRFVAGFIGSPAMSFFDAVGRPTGACARAASTCVPARRAAGAVTVGVRPGARPALAATGAVGPLRGHGRLRRGARPRDVPRRRRRRRRALVVYDEGRAALAPGDRWRRARCPPACASSTVDGRREPWRPRGAAP